MDKRTYNGEDLWQDKLQHHEFPADESAWNAMDALLDRSTGQPTWIGRVWPWQNTSSAMRKWLLGLAGIGLVSWLTILFLPVASTHASSPKSDTKPQPLWNAPEQAAAKIPTTAREKKRPPFIERSIPAAPFERLNTKALPESKVNFKQTKSKVIYPVAAIRKDDFQPPKSADQLVIWPKQKDPLLLTDDLTILVNPLVDRARIINRPITATSAPMSLSALPQRAHELQQTGPYIYSLVPWPKPHRRKAWQVGIIGGGQLAYIKNSNNQVSLQPVLGGSINYRFHGRWALQAEVQWTRVNNYTYKEVYTDQFHEMNPGTTFDSSGTISLAHSVSGFSRLNLTLWEMPLLLKRTGKRGKSQLLGGLRPAWVLSNRSTELNNGAFNGLAELSNDTSSTFHNGIRRFDLAITLGGELQIGKRIWLDARLNQGLFDLLQNNSFQNTTTNTITDFQLTLRYEL